MSAEELSYEIPEPENKIELSKQQFPRFILPDYMVREYLESIENRLEQEKNIPNSIHTNGLAELATKLREHLHFQAEIVQSAHRGILGAIHDDLNKVLSDKVHDDLFHGGSNEKGIAAKPKDLQSIPAEPDQRLGNMSNSWDKDYGRQPGGRYKELPGDIIKPESDPIAKIVHENAHTVYQYYRDVHQRDSLDNKHMRLTSTIHYGVKYANAFWSDVDNQMVYGDGDPQILTNIPQSLDIAGHEMTHGLISFESKLEYYSESGALNESVADVFGLMVKQWKNKQTVSTADWLVGANTIPFGTALRSFKYENTGEHDLQTKTVADMKKKLQDSRFRRVVSSDNGGVHIFSGIPNHAFYLFCQSLGADAKAYDLPAKIWYAVITEGRVRPRSNFKEFAAITVKKAQEFGGDTAQKLNAAWVKVGVLASQSL